LCVGSRRACPDEERAALVDADLDDRRRPQRSNEHPQALDLFPFLSDPIDRQAYSNVPSKLS